MAFSNFICVLSVLLCISGSHGQSTPNWWDIFNTTTPAPITTTEDDYNLLDLYYDNNYDNDLDSGVCCECVPFYQCDENNTIIDDGGDIIGPRFGPNRVTDVELCPDPTRHCCRLPTASPTCQVNANRITSGPDTPCDCINWDFCLEEFRISDGTVSSTFVEGKPLPGHSKCLHSLEVCCEFKLEPEVSTAISTSSSSEKCVCVSSSMCGPDGVIRTDGGDMLDLRNSLPSVDGTCHSPQVCCKEPTDETTYEVTTPKHPEATPAVPVIPTIEDQRCNGIRNSNGISVRINGFKDGESQFGEFPWVGMILKTYFVASTAMNAFIGGAILIHPRVLLTAAHKVYSEAVASLSVRVGEWDIETDYEPGDHQVREVESILIHPRFNNRTLYHDVALVVLKEAVVLQPHIRTICLADTLDEVDTTACVINGWGKDNHDTGNYQTVMKSVTMPLVTNRRCQAQLRRTRLGRWFKLHPSFICAGGEMGKDACTSDGGGPLACPLKGSKTGEYLLVGVTAWGIGCGEDGVPGVYASALADKRWIYNELEQRYPGHSTVKRQAKDEHVETIDIEVLRDEYERLHANSDSNCDPTTGKCNLSTPNQVTATATTPESTTSATPRINKERKRGRNKRRRKNRRRQEREEERKRREQEQ